jgi:hypothetical protein
MIQLALGAVTVFLVAHARFKAAQHAQFALDRHAAAMRHVHHAAGDVHVVGVVGRRLAVFLQRAVHHHRGEAELDGGGAGGRAVAMVLVHADRDVRIHLGAGVDDVLQHDVVGVGARAAAGLHDHGGVHLLGGLHDSQGLFHVVDVEGGQAIAVLGGVIEKLTKRDARHVEIPWKLYSDLCRHSEFRSTSAQQNPFRQGFFGRGVGRRLP